MERGFSSVLIRISKVMLLCIEVERIVKKNKNKNVKDIGERKRAKNRPGRSSSLNQNLLLELTMVRLTLNFVRTFIRNGFII